MTEDWERLPEMDKMYLIEKQREIEEGWQQWEEEQTRLPAKIEVYEPKRQKIVDKSKKT